MKYFAITLILLFSSILDIFFIGGAVYLVGWKNWSTWTIFWGLILASGSTETIKELVKSFKLKESFK